MNANELRIGNLVYNCAQYCYVMSVYKNNKVEFGYFKDSIGFVRSLDNIEIQPIPITEEWLFKFGFEKIPNESYINGNQWTLQVTGERHESGKINRDETWFDAIGDYSWIKEDGNKTMAVNVLCKGNYVCNSVKYIHQLQNLYFALTQTELEIETLQV